MRTENERCVEEAALVKRNGVVGPFVEAALVRLLKKLPDKG